MKTQQVSRLGYPNLDQKCILALLRSLFMLSLVNFDLQFHFQFWNIFFYRTYLHWFCIIFSETVTCMYQWGYCTKLNLNQFWLIISEFLSNSHVGNFTGNAQRYQYLIWVWNFYSKFTAESPRGQWVNFPLSAALGDPQLHLSHVNCLHPHWAVGWLPDGLTNNIALWCCVQIKLINFFRHQMTQVPR